MGKQRLKKRRMKIRQKQKRQQKLAKLRQEYAAAKNDRQKEKALKKVFKIAPWLTKESFLKPIKNKKKSK